MAFTSLRIWIETFRTEPCRFGGFATSTSAGQSRAGRGTGAYEIPVISQLRVVWTTPKLENQRHRLSLLGASMQVRRGDSGLYRVRFFLSLLELDFLEFLVSDPGHFGEPEADPTPSVVSAREMGVESHRCLKLLPRTGVVPSLTSRAPKLKYARGLEGSSFSASLISLKAPSRSSIRSSRTP